MINRASQFSILFYDFFARFLQYLLPGTFFFLISVISLSGFEKKEEDFILENLDPPKTYWDVPEGSCGEACLWSIASYRKLKITQKKINALAGSPGRGIHSGEILAILKKLKIPHTNISSTTTAHGSFLKDKVITAIKSGQPVILGVKIYPDENPRWAVDHFILLVGVNEPEQEFIYNSNDERNRIKLSKLLNRKKGYSVLHKSNYIFAISISL